MDSSVRVLVEEARKIAVSRGLNLPLAKARNVLAMCLYGSAYSAVMAAEKAGKAPVPSASPERAAMAAKAYRCDARLVLDVAQASLATLDGGEDFGEDDEELDVGGDIPEEDTPEFGRLLMAAARRVVMGVERERRRGGQAWADYGSIDEVHDAFGSDLTLQFDDCVGEFTALVDQAINTDGHSLPADLRALEAICRASLAGETLDTAWIADIEASYRTQSKKPPKERQPDRFAINLLLAPNFDAIERRILAGEIEAPRVNMHAVDYEGLAEYLGKAFNFRGSRLRVPNDMLDQTTLHMRAMGMVKGDPEGHDFLRICLDQGKSNTHTVLDVRALWQPLHRLPDRTFAPPPCALTMVMESHDSEDAAQVLMYMRVMVGITTGTPQGLADPAHASTEGKIGPAFLSFLEKNFGMPYKPFVTFTNPCFEKVPYWAKHTR